MTTLSQNNHDMIWQDGIAPALSETAKHKCRAPLKIKDWLDIVIHGKRDPVKLYSMWTNNNECNDSGALQLVLFNKRMMTQHKSK